MSETDASFCPDCRAKLNGNTCSECGWRLQSAVNLPMYREVQEKTRPECSPEDLCPECGKHVREHIDEFRELGRSIQAKVIHL